MLFLNLNSHTVYNCVLLFIVLLQDHVALIAIYTNLQKQKCCI